MKDPDTKSWETTTKKDTITHTREFYTDTQAPQGYDANWANDSENSAPTDIRLTIVADFADDLGRVDKFEPVTG